MFTNLQDFILSIDKNFILNDRKDKLNLLINFIKHKHNKDLPIRLKFICTHNSRRSHLAQIWAQTMAYYFKIDNVHCYSGGTETTAMYSMVAKTLVNSGFQIQKLSEDKNSIYSIKYAENEPSILGFSKKFDDDFNPKSEFCAVMTCNSANEACPLVIGSENRVAITYEDPKLFDNTPQQLEKYQERNLQIATEMFYVFSKIKV